MQTLKNKAFRVSIQWNALVRKLLALARGGFTAIKIGLEYAKKKNPALIRCAITNPYSLVFSKQRKKKKT